MADPPIYSPVEENEMFARMDSNRVVTGYMTILVKNIVSDDGNEVDDTLQLIKDNYTDNAGPGDPGNTDWNKFIPLLGDNGAQGGNLFGEGDNAGIDRAGNVNGILAGGTTPDPNGGHHWDREGFGHSMGDYDCLIYHVTAGCHCRREEDVYPSSFMWKSDHVDRKRGQYYTESELRNLTNLPTQSYEENTWADSFEHWGCQSFVRFSLVSRHNNGYQHDWAYRNPGGLNGNSPAANFEWKVGGAEEPADGYQRYWNPLQSYQSQKVWTARNILGGYDYVTDNLQTGNTNLDEILDSLEDSTGNPCSFDRNLVPGGVPNMAGNMGEPSIDRHVINNGKFSTVRGPHQGPAWNLYNVPWGVGNLFSGTGTDPASAYDLRLDGTEPGPKGSTGFDLSEQSNTVDGSANHFNGEGKWNTYFPPVYDVQIWGEQPLVVGTSGFTGDWNSEEDPDPLYEGIQPVRVIHHPNNYYNLCVRVSTHGFGSDPHGGQWPEDGASQPFNKTVVQVMYQPFGETNAIKFATNIRSEEDE